MSTPNTDSLSIHIPDLKIDYDQTGDPDETVTLTQDWGGNTSIVSLHPSQVRLIAEHIGVLPVGDLEAQRTIARMSRQLRNVYARLHQLDQWLWQTQAKGHEDLDMETTHSMATLEILTEYLDMLPDGYGIEGPPANSPKSGAVEPTKAPASGGISGSKAPKSGGVAGAGQMELEQQQ